MHAWGSTSLSLAFCCVSLELNSRFRNYPIVPTILRNVACKFRNYPMVSTIPIMCACTGFLTSNRELYGTYTAYSTRNSFLDSKTPATVAMGQSPHWNLDSKTPTGAPGGGQSPHWNLDSKTPAGAPWGGPESALESGFENPDWRSWGGARVRIGIWIRKPLPFWPWAQSPHWNLDSKTTALHCQCNLTVRNESRIHT